MRNTDPIQKSSLAEDIILYSNMDQWPIQAVSALGHTQRGPQKM